MKNFILFVFISCFATYSFGQKTDPLKFQKKYTETEFTAQASTVGITNEVWVNRLYEYSVNVDNYEKFKAQGVDLNVFYGKDYKSQVITSEVIVEGYVMKRSYNADPGVLFHTAYEIKVDKVYKSSGWTPSETLELKLASGPVGDQYYREHGEHEYFVGERVILYLEPVQKTIRAYVDIPAEKGTPTINRIVNADRNNPNSFRPLNKFLVKSQYVFEDHHGHKHKIADYDEVVNNIKVIEALNELR